MRFCLARWLTGILLLAAATLRAAGTAQHVVVVVWDGMRPDFISAEHTPTLQRMAQEGVYFSRHHPVYCSATEVNGTAMATGLYPGHSGIIANRDYLPGVDPLKSVACEDLQVIRAVDALTGGHYVMGNTLAVRLRAAGKTTAIAGSKPVVVLQDRFDRADAASNGVVLFAGNTLPTNRAADLTAQLGALPAYVARASALPNEPRDAWTTRALLESFWSNGVPSFSCLWLSEPDFSQHAAGPGSPKALAAIESSDRKLAEVLKELDRRGLRESTDVFVVSDHGFSTIERPVDVAKILQQAGFKAKREFKSAPQNGEILVAGQGGSVLFYIAGHDAEVIRKLVAFLQTQDFTGTVFARNPVEGAFLLEQARVDSPNAPDVMISMRWSDQVSGHGAPGMLVSDGSAPAGQGNHASLSRFDMHNTLVGIGPDLKRHFVDEYPTGNVDITPTVLWLLGVDAERLDGRVLSEALTATNAPATSEPATQRLEASRKTGTGAWHQYLQTSRVNETVYLDEGNGSWTLP